MLVAVFHVQAIEVRSLDLSSLLHLCDGSVNLDCLSCYLSPAKDKRRLDQRTPDQP